MTKPFAPSGWLLNQQMDSAMGKFDQHRERANAYKNMLELMHADLHAAGFLVDIRGLAVEVKAAPQNVRSTNMFSQIHDALEDAGYVQRQYTLAKLRFGGVGVRPMCD